MARSARLRRIALALSLASLPSVLDAAEPPSISLPALRAHAEFLADDLLEGRDTGTRGFDLAARYAATRFAEYGLEPGAGDSYLQPIGFVALKVESAEVVGRGAGGEVPLVWKKDVLFVPHGDHLELELEAPVVFAGFGVEAPELGHRDYEGLDVRGKIVLVLSGAPPAFPATQRAHHSSRKLKAELAASRGAIGVLGIRTRIDAERAPWERMTLNAGRPGFDWKHPDGRVESGPSAIRFQALVSEEAAGRLLASSGIPLAAMLDGGESASYPRGETGVSLAVRARTTVTERSSPNVIALLRGSDPTLASEHVVVTAHLDHVGVGAAVEGDEIYNGFFDNALGSAILLETARALAAAPERPRRSIVFLLVTGEEKGLLGSEYFATYPTVPIESLVANLNIDMPVVRRPFADLVALGAEHSTLGAVAEEAARAHGFELSPDPHPEEVNFVRSDQYSFVRRGVPALNFNPGARSPAGGAEQAEALEEFLKRCYHRPCDEVELGADWDTVARYAAVNLAALARIADDPARPSWRAGDFFGATFAGAR